MKNDIPASRAALEALRLHPENTAVAEAVYAWLDGKDATCLYDILKEHHEVDIAQVLAALIEGGEDDFTAPAYIADAIEAVVS